LLELGLAERAAGGAGATGARRAFAGRVTGVAGPAFRARSGQLSRAAERERTAGRSPWSTSRLEGQAGTALSDWVNGASVVAAPFPGAERGAACGVPGRPLEAAGRSYA